MCDANEKINKNNNCNFSNILANVGFLSICLVRLFQGYSYVSPSVLFSENQLTDDILRPSTEYQPVDRLVCLAKQFKVSLSEVLTYLYTCG